MKTSIGLLVLACLIVQLTACDWLLNHDYPYNLSASDGADTDSITITWDAPNFEEGKEKEIEYYRLERSPVNNFSYLFLTNTTGTSYTDTAVETGKIYYYKVYAHFADGTDSTGSNEDSGFALVARSLPVGDGSGGLAVAGSSGTAANDWYYFYAQKGWPYTIATSRNGTDVDTVLSLYASNDMIPPFLTDDDSGSAGGFSKLSWTCGSTGKYYLKVTADSTAPYYITAWHH